MKGGIDIMSNDFSTFPSGKVSGLTMLYLQKLDISSLSPTELAEKYDQVYTEISDYYRNLSSKKRNDFYGR